MLLLTFHEESAVSPRAEHEAPACPICSGPLAECRGQARCMRCQYCFCQDCDGAPAVCEE
jgi:hypothetical protein